MEELIERSGLANFWPIKNAAVRAIVNGGLENPERDRWMEFKLSSTSTLMIRIHSLPRKKIYDFDDGTMDSSWIYGRLHLTMAYLTSGQFQVISGHRMGGSSQYLDERWSGATLFMKVKRT